MQLRERGLENSWQRSFRAHYENVTSQFIKAIRKLLLVFPKLQSSEFHLICFTNGSFDALI